MIVSNLPNRQREVLSILPTVKAEWGMCLAISNLMKPTADGYQPQPGNVQVCLRRLVDSGHVKRVSQGVYALNTDPVI